MVINLLLILPSSIIPRLNVTIFRAKCGTEIVRVRVKLMNQMKYLLACVLLILSTQVVNSQSEPERKAYSESNRIEGITRNTIYEQAKIAFVSRYNKGNVPLRMNKNNGQLIGSGVYFYKTKSEPIMINYLVKMQINDAGYSLKVCDFYFEKGHGKKQLSGYIYQSNSVNDKKALSVEKKLRPTTSKIATIVTNDISATLDKISHNAIVNRGE